MTRQWAESYNTKGYPKVFLQWSNYFNFLLLYEIKSEEKFVENTNTLWVSFMMKKL